MTLKIKTPPMPKPEDRSGLFTARDITARDAQWLELVGPVVEALKLAKPYVLVQIAQHDMAYRGHPAGAASRAAMEQDLNQVLSALRAITEEQE